MNLNDMLSLVRKDLKDFTEPYRWSDNELERHVLHAVKDFSEALPLEQRAALATVAGSREISISGLLDIVIIEAVEYPADESPRRLQPFTVWAETVILSGEDIPDGSNANLYYGALHRLDHSASTIPVKHEDLIVAGAAGYAATEMAAFAINRINVGGTKTAQEFLNFGKERLKLFGNEISRLGRRNKVRVRRFYT